MSVGGVDLEGAHRCCSMPQELRSSKGCEEIGQGRILGAGERMEGRVVGENRSEPFSAKVSSEQEMRCFFLP